MTLTVPTINRAREIVWVVSGAGKSDAVRRVIAGDGALPAARVRADTATLLVDAAAAVGIAGDVSIEGAASARGGSA